MFAAVLVANSMLAAWMFGLHTGDSAHYLALAHNLSAGHGFSAATAPPYWPEVFRGPGYPLFLAGLLKAGLPAAGIAVCQMALFVAALVLVYAMALEHWGPRGATLAALVPACYLPIVRWMVAITTESLVCFLATCCAYNWLAYRKSPSGTKAAIVGAFVTALFFTRSEFIVLAPALLLDWALHARRAQLARTHLLSLLFPLAFTGIWMARNVHLTPSFPAPLGVGSGMTLWVRSLELLHNDAATVDATRYFEQRDFRAIQSSCDPDEAARADQRLRAEALTVIWSRPAVYLIGSAYRLVFRAWVELESPGLDRRLVWVARLAGSGLLVLSYVGIACYPEARRRLLPCLAICFLIAAVHAATGTEARYTAPLRPMMFMFAAGLVATRVRGRRRGVPH